MKKSFQTPLSLIAEQGIPIWRQIYLQLREQIFLGYYCEGDLLPSIRGLSEILGVSRNTVITAMDALVAEGFARACPRTGFVVEELPDGKLGVGSPSAEELQSTCNQRHAEAFQPHYKGVPHNLLRLKPLLRYDFALGRPDPKMFPFRMWAGIISGKLAHARTGVTEYCDPQGSIEFRRTVVQHVAKARGIIATPEQVIAVSGAQEGLSLAARVLLPQDGTVVVEDPCYRGAYNLFESAVGDIRQISTTPEDFDISVFPDRAHLAYLTPSHQYPLGHTLDREKRQRILDWASTSGAWLLEDDYDSDFRYDGPPLQALTALDKRGSTIYLGTFSKALGAGLRLGFMIVPTEIAGQIRSAKALLNNGQSWLEQAAMSEFIADGHFVNHLRRIRHFYLERRDALIAALTRNFGNVSLTGTQGGMHLAWHIPDALPNADEIIRAAATRDVRVYSCETAAAATRQEYLNDRTLLFGYACLDTKSISEGIESLAQALS